MTYILGEVSSQFGAHGKGAHNVRSNLGEVSSAFGAHGRGAHNVRSMLGGNGIFADRGQMGYVLGEVSSPFGAHGHDAHHVRSMLGGLGGNIENAAASLSKGSTFAQLSAKQQEAIAKNAALGNAKVLAKKLPGTAGLPGPSLLELACMALVTGVSAHDLSAKQQQALGIKFATTLPSGTTFTAPPVIKGGELLKVLPTFEARPTDGGSGSGPPLGPLGPDDAGGGSNTTMIVAVAAVLAAVAFAMSKRGAK